MFRPEDEAEADRDGAAWAYRAGYDPREMAALFYTLHLACRGFLLFTTNFRFLGSGRTLG